MTKVKICGLSTHEAVQTAVGAGADYIGFVFAPSRRQISLQKAKDLARLVKPPVQIVGVFVSPSLSELKEAIQEVPLDMVQIHGEWDATLDQEVGIPLIRAVPISAEARVPQVKGDYLLFDAPIAGSGQVFDWQSLDGEAVGIPYFIAGGLHEGNVQEAIAYFHPFAVDVSSGVETDGQKDESKIRSFIEGVKNGPSTTR